MAEYKQQEEVIVENQRNGTSWKLEAVLPQGEAEGFFLLRVKGAHLRVGPNRVREITLALSNGATYRMIVQRIEKPQE